MRDLNSMSDLQNNKSICAALWTHFMVKPDGKIKPCCRFKTFAEEHTDDFNNMHLNSFEDVEDIFNSSAFNKIRKKMLAGEKLQGCEKCYFEEHRGGGYSMRKLLNEEYDIETLKAKDQYHLRYLETTFGNYCNLGCRTCNGGLSTTWQNDEKELQSLVNFRETDQYERVNVNFSWKSKDFIQVESIKFTGGEPMLHPDFPNFLDTVISSGSAHKIKLDIFTNTSWSPKDKLIDRLSKFKQTNICASIDGYGQVNDYVRHNSSWEAVDQSLKTWLQYEKEHNNITIALNPTMNAYNVLSIPKLTEYFLKLRIDMQLPIDTKTVVYVYASEPKYINAKVLPSRKILIDQIKSEAQRVIKDKTMTTDALLRYDNICKRTMQILLTDLETAENTDKFLEYTAALDKIRNQSFEQAVPEIYEHIQKYGNHNE